MAKNQHRSRGFTLIAALLLTILLSGVAVGLLYMVSNEARMGGNDLEGRMSYYAAEAGMENLTSLLSQAYQTSQNPNAAALQALTNSSNFPTNVTGSNITNVTYAETMCWPGVVGGQTVSCQNTADPAPTHDIVGAGQDAGMPASLIPFNITVTATRLGGAGQVAENSTAAATGASITMSRTVEVALLPAFEFGVFCDGDCDYFAGPPFNFGGRVHTNGSLFLASNTGPLTFTDKISAVGQVVLSQLENGTSAGSSSGSYNGNIYVPSAAGACPNAPGAGPATNCNNLPAGSWTGGFPPVGTANGGWSTISTQQFNGFIITGATGAKKLQLPFVQNNSGSGPSVGAIDIIREPTPGDSAQLSNSRLYNEATIRILLADQQSGLYPGETRSDSGSQDIQIGTPFTNNGGNGYINVQYAAPGVTAGNMYFATAQKQSYGNNNWTTAAPTLCTGNIWPLFGQVTQTTKCTGVWLRVEYCPLATGCGSSPTSWVGVTTQWLSYGFGRNYNQPPTHPYNTSLSLSSGGAPLCQNFPTYPVGQCQNGISPAILILQQLQPGKTVTNGMGTSATQYPWLPLNFYDAREGEPRDVRQSGDTGVNCSPNGIMNVVELDVGNLWLWLKHPGSGPYSGGSGNLVNATKNNGYILYFADHRGMIPDPRPITPFYSPGFSGMSGLADVINSGSSTGVPDANLEPMSYYATASPVPYSPEDVAIKGNGLVDNWGQANLGAGFGVLSSYVSQPYYIQGTTNNAIQCLAYTGTAISTATGSLGSVTSIGTPSYTVATAEWNMVTGPRHALRLVDGGMDNTSGSPTYKSSYLPPTGGSTATNGNGFTVASEEPVYVWGDYNTGPSDPFWPSENTLTTPHSAAAIIADSVTLLSNPPANNTTQNNGGSNVQNVGWSDFLSFNFPGCANGSCVAPATYTAVNNRPGNDSYYRVAIAAGKSIPFPIPAWQTSADMGTDGGMHNFLRYLENRGVNNTVVNYAGSMISMYYSQYNTGIFKCCKLVYGAPKRNYFFDTLFLDPANLPPGTPMFQDVVSLSYHESFNPQ
jgi:Tfp pilus assembly protein PilX